MMQRGKTSKRSVGVFTDLGFAPAEAENLRIRSAMMRALIDFVRKNKLTQARAAKLLGVTQPRISDLMCGKIQLLSIDNLVNLLAAAGLRVDLRVRKGARDLGSDGGLSSASAYSATRSHLPVGRTKG